MEFVKAAVGDRAELPDLVGNANEVVVGADDEVASDSVV